MKIILLMDNTKSARLRGFQTVCKTCLRWSAVLMAEIFILWSTFQYVIWDRDYLRYEKWIGVAVLAAAAVYIVVTVFTDREEFARILAFMRRLCSFEQIMLILLLFWYLVSCAVRSRIDADPLFKFNDNRLFMVTMSVFLFFPLAELIGSRSKRVLEGMFHLTMLPFTPFCAWCIWRYYRAEYIWLPSGLALTCHSETVSMQIGGNVNVTAAASVILFGLCLYMILTQRRAIRIVYIPAAVIQFATAVLTNSRTSFITLLCIILVTAFLYIWDRMQNRALIIRIAASLLAAALGVSAGIAGQTALMRLFKYVRAEISKKEAQTEVETAETAEITMEQVQEFLRERARESLKEQTQGNSSDSSTNEVALTTTRPDTQPDDLPALKVSEPQSPAVSQSPDETTDSGARKMNNLGGRSGIWKAAIKLIFSSPDHFLFGVSPCNVKSELQKASQLGEDVTHAHNGLLQVGVGLGVPAMLIFLLFELGIIARCLNIVVRGKGRPFRYSWSIPVVIMAIMIIELVEAMVFAMVRLNLPAFFILAGCSVKMCRQIQNGG